MDYAKPEIRIEPAGDLGALLSGALSKPCALLRGGGSFVASRGTWLKIGRASCRERV